MPRLSSAVLDEFGDTLDTLVNRHGADGESVVTGLHPHFAELIADPGWLAERYRVTSSADTTAYLLASGRSASWTIVCVVFPPGATTPVHDHLTWGLVGVVQGLEMETRFARTDDGSRPEFARLEPLETVKNTVGAISHVVPPDREIHRIHNPTDEPSCSIHVYGENLENLARHVYDLETNAVHTHRPAYAPTD